MAGSVGLMITGRLGIMGRRGVGFLAEVAFEEVFIFLAEVAFEEVFVFLTEVAFEVAFVVLFV